MLEKEHSDNQCSVGKMVEVLKRLAAFLVVLSSEVSEASEVFEVSSGRALKGRV